MPKTFFISTSIPYVNAKPHVGHAQEFVLADSIARYHRQRGDDVFFLSGTDDNALKNVQAALEAGVPVENWVNEHAENFKKLTQALNISNDDFIQTASDSRHAPGAQKLWNAIRKEDIYKKKYRGLYCVGCEEFKTEKDLAHRGCEEHPGKKLEEVEEENYFFKLSGYKEKLKKIISDGTLKIIPESRKNETLAFIERGLADFSISRSTERAKDWGVPVPGDPSQIMYVWVDALSNYINALGYADDAEQFRKYWRGETTHIIGKGINRFHTIYWPALLLSAKVKLPKTILIHGYITVGNQKMSKSVGNVIDPFAVIKEYGADAVRYYLLREVRTFEDGDFSEEHFKETYNANLANGLGNLASRIMKMASEYLEEPVTVGGTLNARIKKDYEQYMREYRLDSATDVVWVRILELNEYIQHSEPFKTIKTNPQKAKNDVVYLVEELYGVAHLLVPFLPDTAEKIQKAIRENKMLKPLFMRK